MSVNVKVNKALFLETNGFNDMTTRTFETNMSGQNTLNQFKESTNNGASITASAIASVASEFIGLSAQSGPVVGIENGWGNKRLRFILDVEIMLDGVMGGYPVRKIVQGYTDFSDLSFSNQVDPGMKVYFNNVFTLRQSTVHTPYGQQTNYSICEANHILRADYGATENMDSNTVALRPVDVFSTMSSNALGYNNEEVYDLRTSYASSPVKKSRRENSLPSRYLSSTLNAYKKSIPTDDLVDLPFDGDTQCDEARGHVVEDNISSDQFFTLLETYCPNYPLYGFTTYGALCGIFPDLDAKANVIKQGQGQITSAPATPNDINPLDSEHWHGNGLETVWGATLSSSVPSLMMSLMLTEVSFIANNKTLNGMIDVSIVSIKSFVGELDLTPYGNSLINSLITEVLMPLSRNNLIDFNLLCSVDITGNTVIKLTIGTGYEVTYITPSFCDALFSPVSNGTYNRLKEITYDTTALTTSLLN